MTHAPGPRIVVHADAFGADVAAALAPHAFAAMPLDEAMAIAWEDRPPHYVGVALGSVRPAALTALAGRLWSAGHPHGAVILSEHLLACGPLVMPPRSPCVACMLKRMLSLTETPRTARLEQRFQQHQERSPAHELRGHLPTLTMMAALRLRMHATLDRAQSPALTAISFINNRSVEAPVVPLHACPCRGAAESDGGRWAAAIEARAGEVLPS